MASLSAAMMQVVRAAKAATPNRPAPSNKPAPSPAVLPFSPSSALDSSISWRTRVVVSFESSLNSSPVGRSRSSLFCGAVMTTPEPLDSRPSPCGRPRTRVGRSWEASPARGRPAAVRRGLAQTWEDPPFAPVPPERLRPLLPASVPLDVREGSAWVAVTPFRVSAARLRGVPHLPGITTAARAGRRTPRAVDQPRPPGRPRRRLTGTRPMQITSARRPLCVEQ